MMQKIVAMALMGLTLTALDDVQAGQQSKTSGRSNPETAGESTEGNVMERQVAGRRGLQFRAIPDYQCDVTVKPERGSVALRDDIVLNIEVSPKQKAAKSFSLGATPQVFGIYVLGPWGPVQPDPKKVLPENWMHQQHSASVKVTFSPESPYKTKIKLSDYFPTKDVNKFRAGNYQINVKFYVQELGMQRPSTSKPINVEIHSPPVTVF